MQDNAQDPFDGGSVEYPDLVVIVIDSQHVRWASNLDDWNAATLLACISDDPTDWSEIAAVWPRYRTGPSAEFADSLPLSRADLASALEFLRPDEPWLVLDLQHGRIFSSVHYDDVQRDACFGMTPDDGDPSEFVAGVRMSVHLPPWWEIHNDAQPQDVARPRAAAICRPTPRRDVLWGPPLAEGLAEGMLVAYRESAWRASGASDDHRARHPFTIRVHRDWLMTPRDDLGGRIPRESLHGGSDWIDRVIEAQQWNLAEGQSRIPIPRDLSSYASAPMGRSEICMYFDTCRAMIDAGWQWLVDHDTEIGESDFHESATQLAGVLEQTKRDWMDAPYQGDGLPVTIIQDERDRIPMVAGGSEQGHVLDCDCPICKMMAEGAFGPTFLCFDGHHLELDDEFAFSLWETREEWERERWDYADIPPAIDGHMQVMDEVAEPADELGSAWRGSFVADDLPGDSLGYLGLSFRLADMIGELQAKAAPQADIDMLNRAFVDYRHADQEQRRSATERFKDVLERMAVQHPFLISRAADLQSRLDGLLRHPTPLDPYDDIPY